MALGAVVARILTQYSDKGSKAAAKDIANLGKSFDKFSKNAIKAFGLATAAAAAFAVKIGKDAVQAAMEDQKSQALLANSLRNTVSASDSQIASVEKNITALQKQFSVVDDELRPAFGRLTAAFGSTVLANEALQLALNVSAFAGVDLATASDAIIKSSQGQNKALTKLVPGIGAATLATKDFGKITDKVSKIVGGAAATRAETLEGKLAGLKIAFGEILETLGYALLPVIQSFATALQTKVLPAIEAWVATNKDQLAASFQIAADFAIKFLDVAFAFGDWVSNNMTTVKVLAGIIAGMFVGVGIANFIILLASVTAAMGVLATTATGAAIASAFATGGASVALAAGAVGVIVATMLAYNQVKGGSAPATSTSTYKPTTNGYLGSMPVGSAIATIVAPATVALNDFTTGLNNATKATKDKLINEAAAKKNLERQATLSGSQTIAIGASGSRSFGNRGKNVVVNVAGSVATETDLIKAISDGLSRNSRRSFGGGGFERAVAE